MKNQSFYQSILQNSILVIKVSGKICDHQGSDVRVIGDYVWLWPGSTLSLIHI